MKLKELFEDEERSVLSVIGKQPDIVDKFSCYGEKLTSLEGAPSKVTGDVYCYQNNLTSLKGAPTHVEGVFSCWGNKLTSLEGAPSYIGSGFYCYNNKLKSLHNIHKQIKHIGNDATFKLNPIKSHVLGLLLIDGLYYVEFDNKILTGIMNKHLNGDRDVFACQEELIENHYDEYAQL